MAAKEQLKTVMEQHKMEARREQEALTMQVCALSWLYFILLSYKAQCICWCDIVSVCCELLEC